MSCKLEPTTWSHDTGQLIPCFDRCQLIIAWMSNIKEVHHKPRMSLSTYFLEYGRHVGQLRRRRHRRAYTPTSNTASHNNHDKINSWVSFSFLYEYGALLGGPSGRQNTIKNQTDKSLILHNDRLSEKSFVLFIQYPPDEGLFLLDCRQF